MSTRAEKYWSGKNFELNMSFATLRDVQWVRLTRDLWSFRQIQGPFVSRFIPDAPKPQATEIKTPAPTATFTQHGLLTIGQHQVGLDVLMTRSLFECISLIVPEGSFALSSIEDLSLVAVHEAYKSLALKLYNIVAFEIACIGWNRDCQLSAELASAPDSCQAFLKRGHFLAQDSVLRQLGTNPEDYDEVLPGVRWSPPHV